MNNLPSIRQLQYLLALHEHQHFRKAAEACFVGQSTLSVAIQNLEEILKCQLLERDHKSFIFTPIGEDVVHHARQIIQQTNDLTEYTQTFGNPFSGVVRLGCIPTIASFALSQISQYCQEHYPNLKLLLKEDTSDNLLRDLEEGSIDLVLLALPYDTTYFHTVTVAKDPFKLVAHKDYIHDEGNISPNRLPNESIFLLEKEHCLTDHAVSACHLTDKEKVNPFSATSLHTLVQMVNSKLGVTFLPQMAINAGILDKTDLMAYEPEQDGAYREIGFVWRKTSNRVQTYKALAHCAEELLLKLCRC
ncbi:hydrogen peroxide-inducible genes activator [Algicola sagamiensis]|uniref:hydrogen peroxide-inducible genes activator n=1 Tax=Algicola sagamiensis TaxID=163869 RepID=UPI000362A5ED|nr:hydrogen peroxide-inducible genes activator [Algicola sagamiensis]